MGSIELIIGPMFSGKTSELLRRARRYGFAKKSTLLIKFAEDCRYDPKMICTHDKIRSGDCVSCPNLSEIKDAWKQYDVIAIDEGQFFEKIREFCIQAADAGKTIIVAALDATFQREPFLNICTLIPMAESVEKLTAICTSCGELASFSKRIAPSSHVILIGGHDEYMPVCRSCFIKD